MMKYLEIRIQGKDHSLPLIVDFEVVHSFYYLLDLIYATAFPSVAAYSINHSLGAIRILRNTMFNFDIAAANITITVDAHSRTPGLYSIPFST